MKHSENKAVQGVLTLLLALTTLCAGCGAGKAKPADTEAPAPQPPELAFSGDSALRLIERQTAFGPRVPGTEAHRNASDWIADKLARTGAYVTLQKTELTTFDGHDIPMYNILGSLNPDQGNRLLVVAHWDTRPWADQDPDPAKRKQPVTGANDGASGTALILELARVLAKVPDLPRGVDFLIVDAEDWGTDGLEESWAMGTRYFTANPPSSWKQPAEVVVVDMVGDASATFHPEYFSMRNAPELTARIWKAAQEAGYSDLFPQSPGGAVTDDHIPFQELGIPAADIVDYRTQGEQGFPPQWHTTADTPEKLSAKTLEAVGRTLEYMVKTGK